MGASWDEEISLLVIGTTVDLVDAGSYDNALTASDDSDALFVDDLDDIRLIDAGKVLGGDRVHALVNDGEVNPLVGLSFDGEASVQLAVLVVEN